MNENEFADKLRKASITINSELDVFTGPAYAGLYTEAAHTITEQAEQIKQSQGMAEGAVLTVVTLSNEIIRLRKVLERIAEMGEAGSMSYTLAEIARTGLEKAG